MVGMSTEDLQAEVDYLNSSKFSRHLKTNYIPTPSEIPEIKEFADSAASKITLCDDEIAELERQLLRLRSRRTAMQATYEMHMALVSPLRRLPPEILQVIFGWCLPTHRNAVMHASEAPLLLGRVCGYWRTLAYSTPALWASLHIVPPAINYATPGPVNKTRFEKKCAIISSWLARSGTCPLDLSFVWITGSSDEEVVLGKMLSQALVPFANQWRSLDFLVPLEMLEPFRVLKSVDTPALQNFALVDNQTSPGPDVLPWPANLGFVNGANQIRSFALSAYADNLRLPVLPLSHLTALSLESNVFFFFDDAREMLDILAQCQKLQRYTLRLPLQPLVAQPYEPLEKPITLPELTFLLVDCDQHLQNTFHVSNTIGNFITPRLQTLELCGRPGGFAGGGPQQSTIAPVIQRMIRQSGCLLQSFTFHSIALEAEEFVDCLKLMPSLTLLCASNWRLPNLFGLPSQLADGEEALLKALTLPPCASGEVTNLDTPTNTLVPASIICPKLEVFSVTLGNASQKLFCDFAISRVRNVQPGGVPLRLINCTLGTVEEDSTKACFDELHNEGLDETNVYRLSGFQEIDPSPWTGLEDLHHGNS